MKQIMSIIVGLWLITIALLPVAAFSKTENEVEKVSLQLQWKHQFEFAGFYAALEKGFYREAGLDVEIREYDRNIDKIGSVLSGKATFGTDYSTAISARMEGKPVILLANYFKRSPLALVTKPDIYFPGDLKGKRVMGEKNVFDSANFAMMFRQFNMSSDDFTLVHHTYNVDKFIHNEVDAMTVFLTHEVYDLRQAKVPYNVIDPNNYGVPLYDVNLFTSESFAGNYPSVVRSFIDATNRGWAYALAHPEEIVDLIIEKYNTQNASRESLLFEAEQTLRMVQPDIYPVGSIDPNRIRRIEEQFISEGVATKIVEPEDFIFGERQKGALTLTPREEKIESAKVALTQEEQTYLAENPEATVAIPDSAPPFSYEENGERVGFDEDLLTLLSRKTGLRFKPDYNTWPNIFNLFKAKKVDLLFRYSHTKGREAFTLFTKPYYETPMAIFVRDDFGAYTGMESLKGKRVGILKDIFFKKQLLGYGGLELVEFERQDEAAKALVYGRIDALVHELSSIGYAIRKNGYVNLRVADELRLPGVGKEDMRIGVNPEKPLLYAIIKKGLDAITVQERLELIDKWIGSAAVQPEIEKVSLSEEEKAWLKAHPVITASNEQKWAPFNFFEDGQPKGFSIDYLNLLAEKVGLKVDYVSGPSWKEFVELGKNEEIDILLNTAYNEERTAWFDFLEHPYIGVRYGLVVNTARTDIHGFKDILDKTIAVEDGFWMQRWFAENHPKARLIPYENTLEALTAVSLNEADVYVGNVSVGGYLLNKHWLTNLRVVPLGTTTLKKGNDLYVALPKGMTVLKSILDKAMAAVTDEEVNRLAAKWVLQGTESSSRVAEAAGISLSKNEQAYLRKTDEIAYCVDPNWMPFERINDEGQHEGLTADLMKAIERRLGVKLRLVPTESWSESLLSVREGRCQFVSAAAETTPRKEYLDFSKPHGEYPLVVAVRGEELFVENLAAIRDQTLGVVKGYAHTDLIREKYPNFRIIEAENVAAGLQRVLDNDIYGFVDTVPTISYTLRRKGIEHLKIGGKLDIPLKLAFGVHKGEPPELLSVLNKVLDSFSAEEKQLLAEKWFSIKIEKVFDYTRLWQILAAVTVIFLVVLYWNRSLSIMARKLNMAKDEAEAANRAKSVFFASMNHELRTPLNVILGYTRLMARDPAVSKTQMANLETVNRSGEHLLELIDDVLELSKIEAGKQKLCAEDFDLHKLLLGLEGMFRLRAEEKGLSLQIVRNNNLPKCIRADRGKLSQVLINLLENAVNFTQRGKITLDVQLLEVPDTALDIRHRLQFSVSDTGIGIPKAEQERIFDTFSQAEYGRPVETGTGLGLAISRQFVELMGGTLDVESVEGQGSCFSFNIPVEIVDTPDTEAYFSNSKVTGMAPGQPAFRLLVAEDDQDSRDLLVTLLRSVGFEVREAANGREAISNWQAWRPHLIWIDLRMPEMDGTQAIREIRSQPGGDNTKIIALTAHAFDEALQQQVLENGGDDFLRKPYPESELFHLLEKHLGVQFQYAEIGEALIDHTQPEPFDTSDLSLYLQSLPGDVYDRFERAVTLGEIRNINKIIEEISADNDEAGRFLKSLADEFAFDEIARCLKSDSVEGET